MDVESVRVFRSNHRGLPPLQATLGREQWLVVEKVRNGKAGTRSRTVSYAFIVLAAIVSLALSVGSASANNGNNGNHGNGNNGNPCPPASHDPGNPPPCGFSDPAPAPTPTAQPVSQPSGGVLGVTRAHHSPRHHSSGPAPAPTVVVPPKPNPVVHTKHHKKTKIPPHGPGIRGVGVSTAVASAPSGNPNRSTLAERVLSPTQVKLDAKHLGQSGLLAFLLVALLYLPVTIFNKATEKNHDQISSWLSRPHAALVWLMAPFRGHPVITLGASVLLSTALFSFVEPGFPHEDGALEYAIGMLIGFAVVGTIFFATWQEVLHKLEPKAKGHWVIYPPYIVLAAMLVVLARLAHFLPGVVLGTVAEYEPAHPLSRRTAGIRVAVTYGVLMVVGLAIWFAWIPVEHAASKEGASSLTLILDSALAIGFVSALESVAFGLIPMTFLDGNDLYRWNKPLWLAMWSGAILWFSVVVLHPALSTYHGLHGERAIWFGILFCGLMFAAVATWGFFRVRDARLAREAEQTG
jgi:hypothetical protein